jgi:hypothetical protein
LSERPVFVRERGNHAYRTSAYFVAKVFTDIVPLRVVLPIIYSFIVYWLIGYQSGVLNFLRFVIVVLLINVVSASFMLMLSASVRTVACTSFLMHLIPPRHRFIFNSLFWASNSFLAGQRTTNLQILFMCIFSVSVWHVERCGEGQNFSKLP